MNALIALAVWCQPHGPVTILTTQHRRPTSSPSSTSSTSSLPNGISLAKDSTPAPDCNNDLSNTPVSTALSANDTLPLTPAQPPLDTTQGAPDTSASTSNPPHSLEPKKSRRSLQPSPGGTCHSPVGSRPSSAHPALSPSTNNSSCECQFSIPSGEKSLHSVDPLNSEISYISQPVPVDASLFAPIRIACIRSLNAETYCGREGSVFFGDGVNGYVLSYMFTVYDAQSRGHRVKYTIMTMMTDRVYLVANMEYLISQFQVIASNLQSMANALCPPQQSPATRSLSYSSSHHRGSIMPENAPTKRGRPLTDVLAKPDIFVQLHAAFVSVLSNCSRRLTERHIQGRLVVEQKQETQSSESGKQQPAINSLRDLRQVLGKQQFNRLVWNTVVGNQVIVRGDNSSIVNEIIRLLEDILPKDCCTVITEGSAYEPSYACNILGLDRSVPIPTDLDPQDFILLDICTNTLSYQDITPPGSLQADNHKKDGSVAEPPIYQADWSTATLVADMKELSTRTEKDGLENGDPPYIQTGQLRPPASSPGAVDSTGATFQNQKYLLQAGEEPPELLQPNSRNVNELDTVGRKIPSPQNQQCSLYVETINEILDYNKSIQFHNLYKAGKASDEGVVDGFLQSMRVDKRDLKILRFFTRCAKSSSFQSQKYRSEDPVVSGTHTIIHGIPAE
ncbi:hypothetical protein BGZ79_001818 [Entomortierella chlamydospora]|nr:hypothetical protein BGZ79_001818 [Entomortierella chlamydospora]